MVSSSDNLENTVAVIIVNWNGWQRSLECLGALRESKVAPWHLIIVDNASTDESAQKLKDLGSDVTLIASNYNAGWSGGSNIGIKYAIDLGYSFIFILNNDAKVLPNTLSTLIEAYMNMRSISPILGPVHTNDDGRCYNFIGAEIDDRTGLPLRLSVDDVLPMDLMSMRETCFIKGAGIFACKEHFETVGFFDEDFFLNYDETDWSFRARAHNVKLYMVGDAVIRHSGSATMGGWDSPLNLYFMARNSMLFSERHADLRQRLRVGVDIYRDACHIAGKRGMIPSLLRFILSKDRRVVAMRAGLRDYILRRFGDCPRIIRELNSSI